MMDIIWSGPVIDSSGVASFIRNQARNFYKFKDKFKTGILPAGMPNYNVNLSPEITEMLNNLKDMNPKNAAFIKCSWCEDWATTIANYRPKYFLGYTAVEGTKIPYSWVESMNDADVDMVLCMSNPLKDMWIKNGVNKDKIFIMAHGVDKDIFNPHRPKKEYPQLKDRFVFGYLNGWDLGKGEKDRKGPEIMLRAFCEEFSKDENVGLLFKPNLIYGVDQDLAGAVAKLNLPKEHAPIVYETGNFSELELPQVYQAMDCYVSPTKGEGFGITIAEAMAMNKPVIVPRNPEAGYMDFCNDNTAFFCDISHKERIDSRVMGHLYSGGEWVIPDKESLKRKMRWIYENRNGSTVKWTAAKGRELVLKDYTWDRCTERLLEAIKIVQGKDGQ